MCVCVPAANDHNKGHDNGYCTPPLERPQVPIFTKFEFHFHTCNIIIITIIIVTVSIVIICATDNNILSLTHHAAGM